MTTRSAAKEDPASGKARPTTKKRGKGDNDRDAEVRSNPFRHRQPNLLIVVVIV